MKLSVEDLYAIQKLRRMKGKGRPKPEPLDWFWGNFNESSYRTGGLVRGHRAGMHEKARKLFAHVKARILSDGIPA